MNRIVSKLHFATRFRLAIYCSLAVGGAILAPGTSAAADPPRVEKDGTVHVPAFVLPQSSFLDEKTRAALKAARDYERDLDASPKACPSIESANRAELPAIRKCHADAFYKTSLYKRVRDRYDVVMTSAQIGGVYTEVFTPTQGIAPKNKTRVLINLHGGGFEVGSRTFSHLESIPIASVGQIKVISIDYRQAPEYAFPAASADVAAVYRELLKTYKPKSIGIYGCSAGGVLTAQAVAWFENEGLPLPGAVGMFCAAGSFWSEGDSGHISAALAGELPDRFATSQGSPYFKGTDPNDPLVFPVRSSRVLARFPPSLLITSTRDLALSSVVHMHSRLIAQGVDAQLHVWEGVGHFFFFDPDLPQSREVYAVTVKFFAKHLDK